MLNMTLHPDDPPVALFGIPKIVSNLKDYKFILDSYDSLSNGMAFCSRFSSIKC